MKRVLIAVANGSEEIETVSVADVLKRTGKADIILAKVENDTIDAPNPFQCTMSRGIKLQADELFEPSLFSKNRFDALVLPGGLQGAETFQKNAFLVKTVKEFLEDQSKVVGVICASPAVVLQHHGLLDGYTSVTSYPAFKDAIGDKWVDASVVRNRNLVTSQSPGTAIEFGLVLADVLFGDEVSNQVKGGLVLKSGNGFYQK